LKIDDEKRHNNEIEMYMYCVKNRVNRLFADKLIFNKLEQRFTINPIKIISENEYDKNINVKEIEPIIEKEELNKKEKIRGKFTEEELSNLTAFDLF